MSKPYSHTILGRMMIIIALLFFSLSLCSPVSASSIQIQDNHVTLQFPNGVTFHLNASSQVSIIKISLLYSVVSISCIDSQSRQEIDFTADPSVAVDWYWDLSQSGNLPPGSEISWQWEIVDAQNDKLLTDPQTERIEDPNYVWQKLEKPPLTLYWAKGSLYFGTTLLNIAVNSLDRMEKNAGLQVTKPIQLIIYPSAEEMRQALVYTSEWAGGVAFPDYQVVLIGIGEDEISWANQVIPHELTHLITGMKIFNCKGGELPTWLNEGISEYAQGAVPKPVNDSIIAALNQNSLPSLASLAHGFSPDSTIAEQSYNQSWMVVTYMIDSFGSDKLDLLLSEVQKGLEINQALREVYGLDTDGIDQAWRASLGFGPNPVIDYDTETPGPTQGAIPTLALIIPSGKITSTPTVTISPSETSTTTSTVEPSPTQTDLAKTITLTPIITRDGSFGITYLWIIPVFCFAFILILIAGGILIVLNLKRNKKL